MHLYSHRCLDDLLIEYCSAALKTAVVAETGFDLCQDGSFACQTLCLGISSSRKRVSSTLLITRIVALGRERLSAAVLFSSATTVIAADSQRYSCLYDPLVQA